MVAPILKPHLLEVLISVFEATAIQVPPPRPQPQPAPLSTLPFPGAVPAVPALGALGPLGAGADEPDLHSLGARALREGRELQLCAWST